jgi:hypothetical protein
MIKMKDDKQGKEEVAKVIRKTLKDNPQQAGFINLEEEKPEKEEK